MRVGPGLKTPARRGQSLRLDEEPSKAAPHETQGPRGLGTVIMKYKDMDRGERLHTRAEVLQAAAEHGVAAKPREPTVRLAERLNEAMAKSEPRGPADE
jgi:hypothetical protein